MQRFIFRAWPVVAVLVDTLIIYDLTKEVIKDVKSFCEKRKKSSTATEATAPTAQ